MTLRLRTALCLAALATPAARPAVAQQADIAAAYRTVADSLIRAATADSAAYRRLGRLVDTFGHRLSGSASLEAAIDWILDQMKADGLRERARRAGHGAALGAGRGVGRAGEAARAPGSRCSGSA